MYLSSHVAIVLLSRVTQARKANKEYLVLMARQDNLGKVSRYTNTILYYFQYIPHFAKFNSLIAYIAFFNRVIVA